MDAMERAKDAQAEQVHDRRDQFHRLSEDYESAEELGCIRDLVRDTAAATHALSCGTNDRDETAMR